MTDPAPLRDYLILGGRFDAQSESTLHERLAQFLKKVTAIVFNDGNQPYRIAEWSERITFERTGAIPMDLERLYRLRLFNDAGDLSLRRDSDRWLWHYIGSPDFSQSLNTMSIPYSDLAQECPQDWQRLQRGSALHAMVWGEALDDERQTGLHAGQVEFIDDRVGWADLRYPLNSSQENNQKRARLIYDAYTIDGEPAFVWWKRIEWLPAGNNKEMADA